MPKIKIGRSFRLSFNKSTVRLQWKLFTWLNFHAQLILMPLVNSMGLASLCKDDPRQHHVLFLDYDDCAERVAIADCLALQRFHDVGTAVILRSGELDQNIAGDLYGGFHCIMPAKFKFKEVVDIIAESHCDYNFREVGKRFTFRFFVLRIWPKVGENGAILKDRPEFHRLLPAHTKRETNRGMLEFLQKWYHVPAFPPGCISKLDDLRGVTVINYQTTLGWRIVIKGKLKSLLDKMHLKV